MRADQKGSVPTARCGLTLRRSLPCIRQGVPGPAGGCSSCAVVLAAGGSGGVARLAEGGVGAAGEVGTSATSGAGASAASCPPPQAGSSRVAAAIRAKRISPVLSVGRSGRGVRGGLTQIREGGTHGIYFDGHVRRSA